jgi:hypothetical protein
VTATWSQDELRTIAESDGLHIAPYRDSGATTYGKPTWIWSVAIDGELFVRAYNGQNSRWYRAALRQKSGRITAAGLTRQVTFEPADDAFLDRVDEAYATKYRSSTYLKPMIGALARSATVKVMPCPQ